MSVILLQTAKDFLDVFHSASDDNIQMLLDGAEDEALQFMDRTSFTELCVTDSDSVSELPDIPDSVKVGVLLLLQANFQASPEDIPRLRAAAEVKLTPYRCRMGV